MTNRPLIFSAPMVKALLDGRKTQDRRLIRLPTKSASGGLIYEHPKMGGWAPTISGGGGCFTIGRDGQRVPAPELVAIWHQTCGTCIAAPHQIGDRIWVRETWQLHGRAADLCTIVYRASINRSWTEAHEQFPDGLAGTIAPKPFQLGWRSAAQMPRWASRLTLVVTDVRVQRLQEISAADAIAEGLWPLCHPDPDNRPDLTWVGTSMVCAAPEYAYRKVWETLHGPGACEANPWISALTFTVHRENVDRMPAVERGMADA